MSGDFCGINTSALQSLITTHLIRRVLAVNKAEYFMNALITMSLIWKRVFITDNSLSRLTYCPRCAWYRQKWFSRMSAKMPWNPISNTKRIMMTKPMPQNLKKPNTFLSYGQNQISKEAKFLLHIFGGLDLILLKNCYRAIIFWYAKLAPIRRKYVIECGYAGSHPTNLYWIYQTHHANGNRTRTYH